MRKLVVRWKKNARTKRPRERRHPCRRVAAARISPARMPALPGNRSFAAFINLPFCARFGQMAEIQNVGRSKLMKLNPLYLGGFLCFAAVFPSSAQQVNVMQWNIHGNLGTSTAQSSTGAAAIGRILNYLQPDVLLINEVADGTVQVNTSALTQWVTDNLPYM